MKKILKKILERELAFLATSVLKKFRPFIIGVTGSSGKTTTKYMIGELLKSVRGKTSASFSNLNTETGLPMAVLGYKLVPKGYFDFLKMAICAPFRTLFLSSYDDFLVLEYATDRPGDMDALVKIARPDIAVITNFGVAHIEKFGTTEKIAVEKWKLALSAKSAVVTTQSVLKKTESLDQPRVKVQTTGNIATVLAKNIKILTNRTSFDLYLDEKKYETEFSYLGEHNIENLELAVLAVYITTGETGKIVQKIKDLKPRIGRGSRLVGRRDILILDESYNANPHSMLAALRVLGDMSFGRKVAILGGMAEIAPIAKKSHHEIAEVAKKVADLTIGVGDGFREEKLDKWYQDVEELNKEIESILRKGDTVLIKGSHSVGLRETVERLK